MILPNRFLQVIFICSGLVLLHFFADYSFAQGSAQSAIRMMQERYEKINDFSADLFHVREFLFSGTSDTTDQKISLLKEDYFKIETADLILVTDGVVVKDYSIYERRITIDEVDSRSSESFLPKDFLFEFPKRYIPVDYRKSVYKDRTAIILELEPKNPDEELMQHLEVRIDPADSLVKYVKYVDFNENENIYIIDNYYVNTGLTPEDFDILLPDGADIRVIDLRSNK